MTMTTTTTTTTTMMMMIPVRDGQAVRSGFVSLSVFASREPSLRPCSWAAVLTALFVCLLSLFVVVVVVVAAFVITARCLDADGPKIILERDDNE